MSSWAHWPLSTCSRAPGERGRVWCQSPSRHSGGPRRCCCTAGVRCKRSCHAGLLPACCCHPLPTLTHFPTTCSRTIWGLAAAAHESRGPKAKLNPSEPGSGGLLKARVPFGTEPVPYPSPLGSVPISAWAPQASSHPGNLAELSGDGRSRRDRPAAGSPQKRVEWASREARLSCSAGGPWGLLPCFRASTPRRLASLPPHTSGCWA